MNRFRVRTVALLAFLAGLMVSGSALAQEATVLQGKVLDATTGEPLIGAQVVITVTEQGTVTDVDGHYRLQVAPGTYSIDVQYLGYASKTVTGISVGTGISTFQDVALESEMIQAEGIKVVISAAEERGSVIGALAHQRRSTNVINGISTEEISQAPASNAAEAIKRVSSTSIVDGRYVYVRGLGERYSTAQLDGASLPTPEPEKRVLPLDIFPTEMVESLFTVKSYTADLPGDFAGGLVDIQTKDIPEEGFFSLSTGVGFNSNLGDLDRPTYSGGSLDWLGFDDGTRALPGNFPDRIPATATAAERAALHSEFEGGFTPAAESPDFGDVNKSFALSFGDRLGWFGREGGYMVGLSYSNIANARLQKDFYPSLEEGSSQYDYDTHLGTREISLGAIGGYSLNVTPTSRLSLKTIFTQSSEDEGRNVAGPFDQSTSGIARITRFQFVERSLLSTRATYEHKIFDDSKMEWDAAYALALRDEPDTRNTSYLAVSEGSDFQFNEAGNNSRFFSDLTDHMVQGGVKLDHQLELFDRRATIDVGTRGGYRSRDFTARRFAYESATTDVRTLLPQELFTSANIAAGKIRFLDVTEPNDEYDATELTTAGYASLGVGLSDRLRATVGLRVEYNDTQIETFDPRTGSQISALSRNLETVEPLPSLTLQWEYNDEQSLRLAGSRTVVRPQFRELAPFRYDNYIESTLGNPFLENGGIYNLDLRWSWFPRLGEILSFGGFYKHFTSPIEIVRLPTAGKSFGTPEPYNGPSAQTYGLEIEVRNDLGRWTPLKGFTVNTNATFARSNVKQDAPIEVFFGNPSSEEPDVIEPGLFTNGERPMYYQSPYLINAGLTWTSESGGTSASMFYNGVGERLSQVGINGYDDIYETTRHTLDCTLEYLLMGTVNLKATVANVTDSPVQFELGDDITLRYNPGRTFSFKASFGL
ncbi:MAG TPA: TonB-dependent receptor [Gemmatimonadota bacterium]|nr:TonB-dependent receptor [Gemmatimonadota bacterium]